MQSASTLNVLTLSPELEKQLHKALIQTPSGPELQLEPGLRARFLLALEQGLGWCQAEGYLKTALLVDPRIRRHLRLLIERHFPHLPVLSYAEVAPGFKINNLLTLSLSPQT